MDWLEIIAQNISALGNWFSMLIARINSVFSSISSFFGTLVGFISDFFYGVKTLLNGVWDLIYETCTGQLFPYLSNLFSGNDYVSILSVLIGGPTMVFIFSLMIIAMIRIGIGFFFKMLRLNIDYHTLQKHTKKANK